MHDLLLFLVENVASEDIYEATPSEILRQPYKHIGIIVAMADIQSMYNLNQIKTCKGMSADSVNDSLFNPPPICMLLCLLLYFVVFGRCFQM